MKDSTYDALPLITGLVGAVAIAALVFFGSGCAIQEHTAEIGLNILGVEPKISLRSKGIEFGRAKIVVTNVTCACSNERERVTIEPAEGGGK